MKLATTVLCALFFGVFAPAVSGCKGRPARTAAVVVGIAESCPTGGMSGVYGDYARAVYAAGAVPFVLPSTTNATEIARLLEGVDLLLLAGGEDVEPSRYGEKDGGKLGTVNVRRDGWEFALLDEAIRRRLPILGICRGCQVLNVRFGGTLWQDVLSDLPGARVHRLENEGEHAISAVPGSSLSQFMSDTASSVNSRHHQAVKAVAPGFKVTAVSPDGVVEAIEGCDYPALGVQFHPELLFVRRGRTEFLPLFRGDFVEE